MSLFIVILLSVEVVVAILVFVYVYYLKLSTIHKSIFVFTHTVVERQQIKTSARESVKSDVERLSVKVK